MNELRLLCALCALAAASVGCEKPADEASADDERKNASEDEDDEEADDDDDAPSKKSKKKKKKSSEDEDGEDADDPTEEASSPPKVFDVKLAAGRSATPTLAEWDAQREVTVKGSSALRCETKMVREYLRVSCRGKNDTGGNPTGLSVVRGGREALTFAAGDVTSLVIPFVEGIDAEVVFSWTDKSHPLTLKWPRGAPMPTVIGVFEGARSPLDGTARGDEAEMAERLCGCFKKVKGQPSCAELFYPPNPDCDRTYRSDCQKLIECTTFEPSAFPACLPGFANAGTGHACLKQCDARGDSCPAGHTCVGGMAVGKICAPE